jgi:hypothetical protein
MWATDNMPSHLEATDGRDMIFGLLGIVSDAEVLDTEYNVRPDYRLTCGAVYTQTAAALIMEARGPGMNLLQWVQFPKRQKDLPSWVPDWSVPISAPLQQWKVFGEAQGIQFYPPYDASSGLGVVADLVVLSENGGRQKGCLSVPGTPVDTIAAVGRTYDDIVRANTPMTAFNSWARPWHLELDQLSLKRGEHFADDDARHTAVIWTTTADMARNPDGGNQWIPMNEARRVAATLVLFGGLDQSLVEASGLAAALQADGLPPQIGEAALKRYDVHGYIGDIGIRARGRKPFVTEKGYLGLGPPGLREGDCVAVVSGSNVPFVLRAVGTKDGVMYHVVGETYLHGAMYGEIRRNKPKWEIIRLI